MAKSLRVETIGDATLYLGDCLEILPTLPKVDAVITDPPYGVNLGSDPTHIIGNVAYASFNDSEENIRNTVIPAIVKCIELFSRVIVTPGSRCCFMYPPPQEIGAIYFPAGGGFSRWGFTCSQPILFYGKDPYMPKNKKPTAVRCTELADKNGHPCPKPSKLMEWFIDRGSLLDEIVLDPFMGSGTTGVACANLGRKFIGIEIEPKYFDIACERIAAAYAQQRLFA
jgi:DNA modification methylase